MARPAGLERVSEGVYEVAPGLRPGMHVPVRVFGSRALVDAMDDQVFVQAANVATLPGIVEASLCMPDAHWGYGFPIGGVAAFDVASGVISPGGIGFDINCGMRLARTDLDWSAVRPRLAELIDALAARVPAGTGREGFVRISKREFRAALREGAGWAVANGYGTAEDLVFTEAGGCFAGADPDCVSDRAIERGQLQLGTLGSGNHYLEIQVLRPEGLFDPERARAFGLDRPEQVVVMFHCGSRGFGHQVATDYLHRFLRAMPTQVRPARDRPRAGLRADRLHGGARVLRGHVLRREHVLREPPGDPAPRARGLPGRVRPRTPARGSAPSTTWPTTRRSSSATGSAARSARCSSTARARRGPSRPAIRSCPRPIARPASRW